MTLPVQPLEARKAAKEINPEVAAVIARKVEALSRRAEDLASHGAYYAARAEMIKGLRTVTQSLDTQEGSRRHSEALASAMRAFREACDFAPRGSQLEAELDLRQMISGHRTAILKDENVDQLAPIIAQQRYLEYAQQQFVIACGEMPSASEALYGLARIYTVLENARLETQTLCLPKAVALHRAALLVNPHNSKAANELGVLLAQFGQLEDARRVLLHSVAIRPEPEAWHNLSVVHQRLGEADLARRALHECQSTASKRPSVDPPADVQSVQWVDAKTFSAARPVPGP